MAATPLQSPVQKTLPLTYADLVCVNDMDPSAAETTSDLQNLEQDVLHVLAQKKGGNPDDPTRGLDIPSKLNGDTRLLLPLQTEIDAELPEDDRINSSTTTIGQEADGTWTISILIEAGPTVIPLTFVFTGGTLQPSSGL
jgi:hypothetical protein